MEIKAVEWEVLAPGYRGVIQRIDGWAGVDGVEYPELFQTMIWDLARSECTDCSDQIYPDDGPGTGYEAFDEAIAWVRSKLEELASHSPVAGPVNVDANGAPV